MSQAIFQRNSFNLSFRLSFQKSFQLAAAKGERDRLVLWLQIILCADFVMNKPFVKGVQMNLF
jgi:hypothetical protein